MKPVVFYIDNPNYHIPLFIYCTHKKNIKPKYIEFVCYHQHHNEITKHRYKNKEASNLCPSRTVVSKKSVQVNGLCLSIYNKQKSN